MIKNSKKLFFNRMRELEQESPTRYDEMVDALLEYFTAKSKGNYERRIHFNSGDDAKEFSRRYSELRKLLIEDSVTTKLPLPPDHSQTFDSIIGDYVEELFKQNK
ncbi:hypothetical protein DRN73_03450 [Candidatus Pacearchaeota archaeon]|nr:MAG: hypothetical protein DRN73_03450 [Candidatus Pacearchaeota archaeon]